MGVRTQIFLISKGEEVARAASARPCNSLHPSQSPVEDSMQRLAFVRVDKQHLRHRSGVKSPVSGSLLQAGWVRALCAQRLGLPAVVFSHPACWGVPSFLPSLR